MQMNVKIGNMCVCTCNRGNTCFDPKVCGNNVLNQMPYTLCDFGKTVGTLWIRFFTSP